jgi:membrane associated rhomboid family serine protease
MAKLADDLKRLYNNGSIITKLIFINVAAYVVLYFLFLAFPNLESYFSLPGTFKEFIFKPWTIVSYMFLHGGFWHLLMNMLWLFWFGQIFLLFFNNKQFLAVFLLGGFAGALLHLGVNELLPTEARVGIIGASAAVMSIVFAISTFKPDYEIHLMFFGAVKIKYLAIIAIVIDIMGIAGEMKNGLVVSDGVAHFAHLGGALYGIWFGYKVKNGKDITRSFNNFLNNAVSFFGSSKAEKQRAKMKIDSKYNRFEKPGRDKKSFEKDANQIELDRILDKISKEGYHNLTKEESEFLFKQKK